MKYTHLLDLSSSANLQFKQHLNKLIEEGKVIRNVYREYYITKEGLDYLCLLKILFNFNKNKKVREYIFPKSKTI